MYQQESVREVLRGMWDEQKDDAILGTIATLLSFPVFFFFYEKEFSQALAMGFLTGLVVYLGAEYLGALLFYIPNKRREEMEGRIAMLEGDLRKTPLCHYEESAQFSDELVEAGIALRRAMIRAVAAARRNGISEKDFEYYGNLVASARLHMRETHPSAEIIRIKTCLLKDMEQRIRPQRRVQKKDEEKDVVASALLQPDSAQ